jgi:hypothetical protein
MLTVSEQLRVNRAMYSLPAGASQSHGTAIRPLFGWWTGQAGVVGGAFLHPRLTARPALPRTPTRRC